MADNAAKYGSRLQEEDTSTPALLPDAIKLTRTAALEEFQSLYEQISLDKGYHHYRIQPHIRSKPWFNRLPFDRQDIVQIDEPW